VSASAWSHHVESEEPWWAELESERAGLESQWAGPGTWWAERYRGEWVDGEDGGGTSKSATVGGRRRRLRLTTEDSDEVDARTAGGQLLSRSAACLLETRSDGTNAPVTVALPRNS